MSSNPPKNVPSNESEPDRSDANDVSEDRDGDPIADADDHLQLEDEDEDFTLDQLSEAYAKVLKKEPQGHDRDAGEPDSTEDAAQADGSSAVSPTEFDNPQDLDEADNAACPISPEAIVEAILFVGTPKDVKLTSKKIAAVLRDVSPKEVTQIVKKLNAHYESENAAFRIRSEKGALEIVLDKSLDRLQQDFFGRNRQIKLSQAAINVMAVVAYNQPATKEQVEKIRAKPSGSILSQLVRRNLLAVEPRENFQDRKRRFSTTDKFLDFFSLDEIADLPQSHEVADIDELAD